MVLKDEKQIEDIMEQLASPLFSLLNIQLLHSYPEDLELIRFSHTKIGVICNTYTYIHKTSRISITMTLIYTKGDIKQPGDLNVHGNTQTCLLLCFNATLTKGSYSYSACLR